jgi:hypothetical protein
LLARHRLDARRERDRHPLDRFGRQRAFGTDRGGSRAPNRRRGGGEEEGGPRAGIEEAQEEAEVTAERLEALEAANAAGKFGGKVAETTSPAAGWIGSQIMNPTADDWEPVHRG